MAIMDITVDMCVIKLARKERISPQLSEILDEIDIPSFHEYMLPPNTPVELHYRDFDEYWLFREGIPTVTLRHPDGTKKVYQLDPGELVAAPKRIEHTLHADHTFKYFQFSGIKRPGIRPRHLVRGMSTAHTNRALR